MGAGASASATAIREPDKKDGNVSAWATTWTPAIVQSLAFFDGLDSMCGNQLARNQMMPPYSYLAGLLASDALLVDTSKTTCNQYLGVELAALSLGGLNDCGGRTLSMDVIDITYSALVGGQISGLSDGVSQSVAPSATFPFFSGPAM